MCAKPPPRGVFSLRALPGMRPQRCRRIHAHAAIAENCGVTGIIIDSLRGNSIVDFCAATDAGVKIRRQFIVTTEEVVGGQAVEWEKNIVCHLVTIIAVTQWRLSVELGLPQSKIK